MSRRVAVALDDAAAGGDCGHSDQQFASDEEQDHDDHDGDRIDPPRGNATATADTDPNDTDATNSSRRMSSTARKYSVEVRSIAQNRRLTGGGASSRQLPSSGAAQAQDRRHSDATHQQPQPQPLQPPPLDLEQLHRERRRSTIRRTSTRARRLDDAPDSLRLESTRRRASSVMKEPSRASVVYSPRALADLLARERPSVYTPPRRDWAKSCSVM